MEKTYNPKTIEQHWYQTWEQKGYFTPQNADTPYCIMIPPPNVTGTLHMGHAFQEFVRLYISGVQSIALIIVKNKAALCTPDKTISWKWGFSPAMGEAKASLPRHKL